MCTEEFTRPDKLKQHKKTHNQFLTFNMTKLELQVLFIAIPAVNNWRRYPNEMKGKANESLKIVGQILASAGRTNQTV